MKITNKWLKEKNACQGGRDWFNNQKETDGLKLLKALITADQLSYANWLIVHVMSRKQRLKYAIFAAEQVINIFEKKYPKDDRPRKAIEAAERCLKSNTARNRNAANAAANAAYAAADAAYADAAAYAAADAAAYAAADAAADAAYAAADAAAYAAAYAAARKKMQLKILNYGIRLLEAK